jgi:hypothetical protein
LEYLYLGFEAAALREFQVAALFVENPEHPGVSEIGPLGNGIIETNSLDVDGLDALQKLSFKYFAPSVACLLGDEFADGTYRNFRRTKMRWATGQGVFRMDSDFSNVPAARVQQFNRNPQGPATLFPESNADFIEVAIPLAALGDAEAPTTLRVGAVVYGDAASGPLEPQFDTAFLGQSLTATADGGVMLEPINIQLAADPNPGADQFNFRARLIAPTTIRFSWDSTPSRAYQIQSTPEIGQAFQNLSAPGMPLVAVGTRTTFDLAVDVSAETKFFRLAAQ